MKQQTPFWNRMQALVKNEARFHVPGHKGNPAAIPPFGGILRYDMTEVEGADDLSHPTDTLAQSQQNMARLYGSGATLYSASGSTSCIQAMLTLFVKPEETVVMARGCHVAAIRALGFIGAVPHWVYPAAPLPTAAEIEAALAQSHAKAVYLTSPDYEGNIADIAAIAAVCHGAGAVLLVDNAHGAHLKFLRPDIHPITLGADATADSAHKTLPCLTPAAMLHLKNGQLAAAGRAALNLYSSTSPSYLVLQSLDIAAGMLATQPPNFMQTAAQLAAAIAAVPHLVQLGADPLKLCLTPWRGGWQTSTVTAALQTAGILPELADERRIVLMASPYNQPEDFALLAKVLAPFTPRPPLPLPALPVIRPKAVCSIRSAMFAPAKTVPVQTAPGQVMAGLFAPCPPGVPLVMPGEELCQEAAKLLAAGGILTVDVLK
ncbi:aminotransferase class I/II-fold pyridoxal phosphate-dependent enzyme [Ruminococcaceae bacterium OttesenSCG-928-A16]|nr:aminotransferase class I/II-fold pyridoxal phosphate-dependent enzyme [Ruminococcaceae bacterium OttesenSCG-928-A16]